MARYNNGRITNLANALGLEDDDYVESAGEEMSDAELVEAGNEVDDSVDEVDAAVDTGEDLAEDTETLANVGEVVDDAIESGEGLSEDAATVVEETIENILRRHGMKRHMRFSYPSMENFDSKAGRMRAAKQLKVTIESFIDTILQGIKNLFESIKQGFKRVFGSISGWEDGIAAGCDQMMERFKAGGEEFADYEKVISSVKNGGDTGKTSFNGQRKLTFGWLKNLFDDTNDTVDLAFVAAAFNDFVTEVDTKMPRVNLAIQQFEEDTQNMIKSGAADATTGELNEQASADWVNKASAMDTKIIEFIFNSSLSNRAPHKNRGKTSKIKYFNVDTATKDQWTKLVNNIRVLTRKHQLKKLEKYSFNAIEKFFNWFRDLFNKFSYANKHDNVYLQGQTDAGTIASANANIGNPELKTVSQATKGNLYQFRKLVNENITIYKDSVQTAYNAAKEVLKTRMLKGEIGTGQRTA